MPQKKQASSHAGEGAVMQQTIMHKEQAYHKIYTHSDPLNLISNVIDKYQLIMRKHAIIQLMNTQASTHHKCKPNANQVYDHQLST